jgi:hypothetical protein
VADFDSADLLARCRDEAQEPTVGTTTTAAQWYALLTASQHRVYRLFAMHVPHVLMSAPTAMTSSDSGYTYTVPSSVYPYGLAEIRHGRSGPLLTPGAEFSNTADFVWEGNKIRIPHGVSRTFGNGLYIRYIAPPSSVSASVEPTLTPDWARVLLVFDAVREWAGQGNLRDPAIWSDKFALAAFGDGLDVGIIGTLKGQLVNQGADAAQGGGYFWWRHVR